MFRLEDFKCSHCGNKFEELVEKGTKIISCKKCGGLAERIISVCNWAWKYGKDSGRNKWF